MNITTNLRFKNSPQGFEMRDISIINNAQQTALHVLRNFDSPLFKNLQIAFIKISFYITDGNPGADILYEFFFEIEGDKFQIAMRWKPGQKKFFAVYIWEGRKIEEISWDHLSFFMYDTHDYYRAALTALCFAIKEVLKNSKEKINKRKKILEDIINIL